MTPTPPNPISGQPSRSTTEFIVDTGGFVCVLGYLALAYYSWGSLGEPSLAPFFALIGWVALPWLAVFALLAKHPDGVPVGRLIIWAVAFRVCGLFGVPLFEDDYFRYLWDGYRFAETGTPYGWAPAASFADDTVPAAFHRVLDQVNYPDVPTIYGPTTQFVFLLGYLVAPASLWPVQVVLIGVDILLIRLLATVAAPRFVLLYAWCPLVIKEIAFTAHPDGFGAFLLVTAILMRHREHTRAAAVCLALAVGAKVFALLLVPFVLARADPRAWFAFAASVALLYLPFVIQGGTDLTALALVAASWEFNSALFGLLSQWLPAAETKWLLGCVLVVIGGTYWLHYSRHSAGQIPRGDWIFGCFLLAAPVINPWYALWLLPFAVVYPSLWAWTASLALLLSYVTGLNLGVFDLEPFAHPVWLRPVEFGLILAAAGVDVWRRSSMAVSSTKT
ncbi:MAG: hypothetical protein OXU77_09120 [Gammaproteobacteria bacterium]|nr:hypothetical protein [Gammaproteobacteria bacterium]